MDENDEVEIRLMDGDQLRYNASQRLIHQFRMQTGTSLLYPSFPACC